MENQPTGVIDPMVNPEEKSSDTGNRIQVQTEAETERAKTVSSVYPSVTHHAEPAAVVPTPPAALTVGLPADDKPVPVVKVLSVRGVEYAMMSILLWFGAGALIAVFVTMVLGGTDFAALSYPIAMLLVCLPAFSWLFLRLRKAELDNPALRLEPSKRRFSQITQILSFLTCFFTIVTVVYSLISAAGGEDVGGIGKILGVGAIILIIAGGILTYYWFDEHRLVNGR